MIVAGRKRADDEPEARKGKGRKRAGGASDEDGTSDEASPSEPSEPQAM